MKKIKLTGLLTAACLLLCSCSGFGVNVGENISPPKPSGELYDIQQTLERAVGHDLDFVYPSSGEYRSAIITQDIDADGKYDVFSFYSTETDDKTTVMHINYIRWIDDKWVSVSDLTVEGSGVESIEFVKLDNASTPKILVNWNRYSATNKLLSVYSIDQGTLSEVTSAEYSVYSTCDFDSDGIFEIVALHLDSEAQTSTAKLLGLGDTGFTEISTCQLDPNVTSYYTPQLTKLKNGNPALFIDAVKATGMITEVLYIKDNGLVNAFPPNANGENVSTMRASSVRSADYDGDGCLDIPLAQKLPTISNSADEDTAYLTVWNSFDGNMLSNISNSIINYTDGYYFELPENWVGMVAVERRPTERERIFYRWDQETETHGEEILRITAIPIKEWEINPQNYTEHQELARNPKLVYTVRFASSALNPGESYFKENLKVIAPDEVPSK